MPVVQEQFAPCMRLWLMVLLFCHAATGIEGGKTQSRLGACRAFAICPASRKKGKMNHHQKYRSGWKNTTQEMFPNYLGKNKDQFMCHCL